MQLFRPLALAAAVLVAAGLSIAPAQAATASKVTATVSAANVAVGAKASVTGSVTPGTYRPVTLQEYRTGAWRTLTSSKEASTGKYKLTIPALPIGAHKLRVYAKAWGGRAAAASATRTLTVKKGSIPYWSAPTVTTSPTTHVATVRASGTVAYAPAGAKVVLRRNDVGYVWYNVSAAVPVMGGKFTVTPTAKWPVGRYRLLPVLLSSTGAVITDADFWDLGIVTATPGYVAPTVTFASVKCNYVHQGADGSAEYDLVATFTATGGRYTDFGGPDKLDEEGTVVDGGVRTFTTHQMYWFDPGLNPDLTRAEVQAARYLAPVSTEFQTPGLDMLQRFYATVDLTSLCTVTPG